MAEFGVAGGLAGGLVAAAAMAAAAVALDDERPPPTAALWARVAGGGDPADHLPEGLALHLGYGVLAGGGLAVVAGPGPGGSLAAGLLWGVAWALALFVVGTVGWLLLVLGVSPDARMAARFGALHLVYGVVLGAWAGLGVL